MDYSDIFREFVSKNKDRIYICMMRKDHDVRFKSTGEAVCTKCYGKHLDIIRAKN